MFKRVCINKRLIYKPQEVAMKRYDSILTGKFRFLCNNNFDIMLVIDFILMQLCLNFFGILSWEIESSFFFSNKKMRMVDHLKGMQHLSGSRVFGVVKYLLCRTHFGRNFLEFAARREKKSRNAIDWMKKMLHCWKGLKFL